MAASMRFQLIENHFGLYKPASRSLQLSGGKDGLAVMKKIILSMLLAFGISVNSAQAVLMERDLLAAGDGLITFDDQTNLEWLDVSATRGLLISEVQGGAGGWISRGFSYATQQQVENIFTFLGIPLFSNNSPNRPEIDTLISFLGNTYEGHISRRGVRGWTGTISQNSNFPIQAYAVNATSINDSSTFTAWDISQPTNRAGVIGHFLIRPRTMIPEPATLAIFGLGLAGLGFMRRRRAAYSTN